MARGVRWCAPRARKFASRSYLRSRTCRRASPIASFVRPSWLPPSSPVAQVRNGERISRGGRRTANRSRPCLRVLTQFRGRPADAHAVFCAAKCWRAAILTRTLARRPQGRWLRPAADASARRTKNNLGPWVIEYLALYFSASLVAPCPARTRGHCGFLLGAEFRVRPGCASEALRQPDF